MNLSYFPYLFFFVLLEVLFSYQKLQKIHIKFDMIELSKLYINFTALISSLTLTNNNPLSAQFIVICLIN